MTTRGHLIEEFLEKHGASLKSGMKKVVKRFDEMDERFTDAEAEAWAESLLLRHRLSGKKGGRFTGEIFSEYPFLKELRKDA